MKKTKEILITILSKVRDSFFISGVLIFIMVIGMILRSGWSGEATFILHIWLVSWAVIFVFFAIHAFWKRRFGYTLKTLEERKPLSDEYRKLFQDYYDAKILKCSKELNEEWDKLYLEQTEQEILERISKTGFSKVDRKCGD